MGDTTCPENSNLPPGFQALKDTKKVTSSVVNLMESISQDTMEGKGNVPEARNSELRARCVKSLSHSSLPLDQQILVLGLLSFCITNASQSKDIEASIVCAQCCARWLLDQKLRDNVYQNEFYIWVGSVMMAAFGQDTATWKLAFTLFELAPRVSEVSGSRLDVCRKYVSPFEACSGLQDRCNLLATS